MPESMHLIVGTLDDNERKCDENLFSNVRKAAVIHLFKHTLIIHRHHLSHEGYF